MSTKFSLGNYMNPLAESAEFIVRQKYRLGAPQIDKEIHPSISWRPTMYWKTKEGYIAVEVTDRPFPQIFHHIYGDLVSRGETVKIISAFPIDHTLSAKDFQAEKMKAKSYGIGLLSVESGKVGQIEHPGIYLSMHLPQPSMKRFNKTLHVPISHAYEIYGNIDPSHGVQELGQICEKLLNSLADDVKRAGGLTKSGFKNKNQHYPLNKLIADMIDDNVLDKTFLKRCASFADIRNSVSHKPGNIKEAIKSNARIKESFTMGLSILEDFPEEFKKIKYKFSY